MLQSSVFKLAFLILGLTCGVIKTSATGGRIVEGGFATIEEFPYQAYISHYDSTHCGGSIIDQSTILTAAHCIELANKTALRVRVGVTDVTANDGITRKVAKAIVHEHYNDQTVENDIAILILDKPLEYTEAIKSIKLPKVDEHVDVNTKAFVSGWGLTKSGGSTSPVLKYAEVFVVGREECQKDYSDLRIGDKMMCAGKKGTGKPCSSDSGGPLAIFDTQGYPTLVGIVSFGIGCKTGKSDVYTNVSSYIEWIRQNMQ